MDPDDERAVRALYDRIIDAWNARDARSMAAELTDDGEIIGFDGTEMHGGEPVAAALAKLFAAHPTGTCIVKVRSVQSIAPGAAIVRAVSSMIAPGMREIDPATNVVIRLVVVKRDGAWRVALFQHTPAQLRGRPEASRALSDELQARVVW